MNKINVFLQEKQLSTISTTVPDRLDYLMRLHNLTNIALSEIMCCAESTISGYRTGRRVPDIFVICHLSTILVSHPIIFLDSQTKFVQLTTDYVIYTRPSGITSQPSPAADANVT